VLSVSFASFTALAPESAESTRKLAFSLDFYDRFENFFMVINRENGFERSFERVRHDRSFCPILQTAFSQSPEGVNFIWVDRMPENMHRCPIARYPRSLYRQGLL
jgi:hypothetical protein